MVIRTKPDKGEGGVEKWTKIPDVLSAQPLMDFLSFFLDFPQIQGMILYHVLNLEKGGKKMVKNSDFDNYFHEFS